MNKNLQEKIKLSEDLIDKYLNEFSPDVANLALQGVSLAQGLGHDVVRISQWAQKKMEERKRRRMLAKQEKQKQKQMEERKRRRMLAKQEKQKKNQDKINQQGPSR